MRALLPILAASVLLSPLTAGSLVDAVKSGNLPAVQQSLDQRADPNQAGSDGTTALHWAVQSDRLDIVQALISAGARVNVTNRYGITPLALAVTTGNPSIAGRLLKAGADPNVPVPELGTPLLAAARTGNPEVLKELLDAGVNVNQPEPASGQTALMWAATEAHEAAVDVLLAAGADSRARSHKGESALFFAVRAGDIGVVDALLAAGADVNERAEPDNLSRPGNPDPAQSKSKTPGDSMLVVAIVNGHFGLADFLLNKGADPNAAGVRWPPLHALVRVRNYEETQYPPPMFKAGDLDSLDLAAHLLAHGADPNTRSTTKTARRTPGDQNYAELQGATPFFLAAKAGDVPMMRLLLSAHADSTIPSDDHTSPLMVASGVGCVPGQWIEPERDILAAVKILVDELKADVNVANDRHETPLHGAVCRGADFVVQYLADRGANLDAKDVEGKTPLDTALNGIFRATSIGGPPIIILRFPEHTATLVKKLTAEQHAASSPSRAAVR